MQGHKHFTHKVNPPFRLSERIPRHNLYHRLRELRDWDFLYRETQPLYRLRGRPLLDPVVFFKLLLVGRLENIVSDRRLRRQCAVRLDILYFLGYELDEELPWHSTSSRTRQRYPDTIFARLFDWVFARCVAQELVAGERQAVDAAPVKAKASLDSLLEKQAVEEAIPALTIAGKVVPPSAPAAVRSAPAYQLQREANRQARHRTEVSELGAQHEKARLLSNKTHYSPTGPEARISVKPGKARALNYLCSVAVDTAHGVISHVQADLADSRDSLHLPRLLTGLLRRLQTHELRLRDLLADAAYANGPNYALLEEQGVTAWLPVFGQYKPTIKGFTYDPTTDQYTCQTGKPLPFQKYDTNQDGGWLNIYWAAYRDWQDCPLKSVCAPKASRKQLTKTIYDAAYRRAWQRQQTRRASACGRCGNAQSSPCWGTCCITTACAV